MNNKIAVCDPGRNSISAAVAALSISGGIRTAEPEVFEFYPDGAGWPCGLGSGRLFHRAKDKKLMKCLLPGCDNKTTHNGGYCCAEHCRAHKEMRGLK